MTNSYPSTMPCKGLDKPIKPIAVNLTLNKGACPLVRKPTLWQRIKRLGGAK